MKKVIAHFQKNEKQVADWLLEYDIKKLSANQDAETYFARLSRAIIGQQLSTKVAHVIGQRFVDLFENAKNGQPSPQEILEIEGQKLREIGLSWSKVRYVKDLADKVNSGVLKLERLPKMTNQEVIDHLVQVKGIGQWTAEMFLIFNLGREDVYSFGDLGLRRAFAKLCKLEPKFDYQKQESRLKKWQPYSSYAALALWASLDNSPKD